MRCSLADSRLSAVASSDMSWKQLTAPTIAPSSPRNGSMLATTLTRVPSGRSITIRWSWTASPVRNAVAIGVWSGGIGVPSLRNSRCAPP